MKITDKCKEDFEKYLTDSGMLLSITGYDDFRLFHKLPMSVRYIIINDFFYLKGVIIDNRVVSSEYSQCVIHVYGSSFLDSGFFGTELEVRDYAINTCNKYYNKVDGEFG